jgi:polysaccharide export outer membrane protein
MTVKSISAFLLALLVALPALAEGDEAPGEVLSREVTYEVGAGDVLDVRVYGEEDLSKNYTLNRDGELVLPYVGRISVVGMTVNQVAIHLEARLRDGFLVDPQVTAQVHEYKAKPIQILGEVKEPGVYYLRGESDVPTVLARAGGAPENVTRARVLRKQGSDVQTFEVDLEALSRGESGASFALQAGDTIHVLPAARIFVSGEVKAEGAVAWREGMTAWQALTKAGGPTRTAKLKGAYVLRQGNTIEVDLKAVKQGKAEDVVLRPDDQLVLPESIF